jgi:hypothetical protein
VAVKGTQEEDAMRTLRIGFATLVALACLGGAAQAQPSFAGTWKLNLAKSQLTGQTLSIEKKPSGVMRFDMQGFAYDFDVSGKDFPTPDGGTASWREVSPTTWEATNKVNGKLIASYVLTLKGDTITAVTKATKPDGSTLEQTSAWSRVSGGPGFLGKWKSTDVKGAPNTLQIALDGTNGITMTYPEFQIACKGSFDGKDYPVTGAGGSMKQTMAFEKPGPNSIKISTKVAGKPFYVDVLTLSADGKTLTDDGNPVAVKEPVKAVYERQ